MTDAAFMSRLRNSNNAYIVGLSKEKKARLGVLINGITEGFGDEDLELILVALSVTWATTVRHYMEERQSN